MKEYGLTRTCWHMRRLMVYLRLDTFESQPYWSTMMAHREWGKRE